MGPSVFLVFYCNFVKHGLFATKFCTHDVTDNVNKCCKVGYCMISTFSCVHAYIVAKPYVPYVSLGMYRGKLYARIISLMSLFSTYKI